LDTTMIMGLNNIVKDVYKKYIWNM
jgi:hypothetical protein